MGTGDTHGESDRLARGSHSHIDHVAISRIVEPCLLRRGALSDLGIKALAGKGQKQLGGGRGDQEGPEGGCLFAGGHSSGSGMKPQDVCSRQMAKSRERTLPAT